MKAIIFETNGGPEVLQYKETPKPAVGHNEVLIQVKASACNYNDIWARRGLPGMEIILPHISGSDVSGVIASGAADPVDFAFDCELFQRSEG